MTRSHLILTITAASLLIIALNTLIVGVALQSIDIDLDGLTEALDWRSAPTPLPSSCC
jgi:hypothetical protein